MGLADTPAGGCLDDVVRLFNRGLSVFPVSTETKHPLIAWKRLQDSPPTIEEVTEWFTPNHRAVGVACGPVSNLFLVDFDSAKHPEAKIFYETHTFPRTWMERTKSGGVHLYFKWDTELDSRQSNTTSALCRGVDTKGKGGYSKICPSEGYEWIVAPHMSPLAQPPQWLIDALPSHAAGRLIGGNSDRPSDWIVADLQAIVRGDGYNGRTPTFTRVIGYLKAKGLSEIEVRNLLTPWAAKYEYDRLNLLVADLFRRYPPRPQEAQSDDASTSFCEFLADTKSVEWVVPGLIPVGGIGFIAGLPESIKTWMLIDLAIEFARGHGMWLGKFPTEMAKVLYLDQERGKDETGRRFKALMAAKGITGKDLEAMLAVKCGTSFRLNLPQSREKFERLLDKFKPSVVIVDSFKTFHTKNELATYDMQEVMNAVKELRTKFGCVFLFVHHETKSVHQRRKEGAEVTYLDASGTIDLPQTSEVFFNAVSRGEGESLLYHTKATQGKKIAPVLVKVRDMDQSKSKIIVEAY